MHKLKKVFVTMMMMMITCMRILIQRFEVHHTAWDNTHSVGVHDRVFLGPRTP